MEIIVYDTENFPEKATLSVRVGDTRRLQACRDGPTELRFPSLESSSLSLDLLQQVSTQQISLQDWKSEGCQDKVQRITLPSPESGKPMSASLKFSLTQPQSAPSKPKRSRHQVTLEAKSYLDKHGVQELVQGLLHDVLKHHPADPVDFMMQYLDKFRSKSKGSKSVDAFQPPSRPSQDVKTESKSDMPDAKTDAPTDDKAWHCFTPLDSTTIKKTTEEKDLSEQTQSASPVTKSSEKAASISGNAVAIDLEAVREKARKNLDKGIENGTLANTLTGGPSESQKIQESINSINSMLTDGAVPADQTPPTTAGEPSAAIGSLPSTAEGPDKAPTLDGTDIAELKSKVKDVLEQGLTDGNLKQLCQSVGHTEEEPTEPQATVEEQISPLLMSLGMVSEPMHMHNPFESMPGLNSDDYPGFSAENCPEIMPSIAKHHSIMTDILKADPDLYGRLKDLETSYGVKFGRCIKTGMDNPGHPLIKAIGCVAGDVESYELFHELFDQAIDRWHDGWKPDSIHPTDLDVSKLSDMQIDPSGKYALSTRVRAGRSIQGLRLPPACDRGERCECERLAAKSLLSLPGDLKGDYYPLKDSWTYAPKPGGMSFAEEQELSKDSFLFQEPDSIMMLCTGMGRNWPEARGVFASHDKKLVVWVNEEEHLRLVSMDAGCNLQQVFKRFVEAVNLVEHTLEKDGYGYMHNAHLGFISACPSSLGTGLRASVMLKIPLVSVLPAFRGICKSLGLEVRTAATADFSGGGVWDVANLKRLGISEVDSINQVISGCIKLIELEQMLERGDAIDDTIESWVPSSSQAKDSLDNDIVM